MEPNIELMNFEAYKTEIKEHDVQILYKCFIGTTELQSCSWSHNDLSERAVPSCDRGDFLIQILLE